MRPSMCVCVGVSLRNDLLRNKGAIQSKFPHNQKIHISPRSNKCKGIPNLTKKTI